MVTGVGFRLGRGNFEIQHSRHDDEHVGFAHLGQLERTLVDEYVGKYFPETIGGFDLDPAYLGVGDVRMLLAPPGKEFHGEGLYHQPLVTGEIGVEIAIHAAFGARRHAHQPVGGGFLGRGAGSARCQQGKYRQDADAHLVHFRSVNPSCSRLLAQPRTGDQLIELGVDCVEVVSRDALEFHRVQLSVDDTHHAAASLGDADARRIVVAQPDA